MQDYVDLLIRQKWQEVVSGFHNLYDDYGSQIGVAVLCAFIVWVIARLTKKQKHA